MPDIPCSKPGYYASVVDSAAYSGRAFIRVSTHATPAEVRALIAALEPYAAAPTLTGTEWLTGPDAPPQAWEVVFVGGRGSCHRSCYHPETYPTREAAERALRDSPSGCSQMHRRVQQVGVDTARPAVRYAIEYASDEGDWRPTKRFGLARRTWATEAEASGALHSVLGRPSHRITNYRVVAVDA